jgi:hypothetical protein
MEENAVFLNTEKSPNVPQSTAVNLCEEISMHLLNRKLLGNTDPAY